MLSYREFYRPGITTYVWNKLFKREILMECRCNVDEHITIGEDVAVTYFALLKCRKVSITDNVAYHYWRREDFILKCTAAFNKEVEKMRYLYEYLMACVEKSEMKDVLLMQIDDYVLANCFMSFWGKIPQFNSKSLKMEQNNLGNEGFTVFGTEYYGKNHLISSRYFGATVDELHQGK